MSELTALTIAAARDGLKQKKFSAAELADAHLAAMEKARSLNAYVLETPERAAAMAKASDARIAKGHAGPLEGVPLAIKDMFCTEGVRTTACSHILDNFVPTYESTVSSHLWRDGAVLLGKTNNDEFAMGSSNETSFMGNVTSPWRRKGANTPLVPGGSSGGSAAAVAAHLCLGATGTDTGGSIRQPAAFTGTVGLKPTYGRVSRWGTIAFASSLDQAGPITRTVEDAALLLRSMCSFDTKDSTSLDVETPDWTASVGRSVKGLRIGVPRGLLFTETEPLVAEAFERYAARLRRLHPDRSVTELYRLASRFVSPPEVAPHTAGAAVDVADRAQSPGPARRPVGADLDLEPVTAPGLQEPLGGCPLVLGEVV